MDEAHAYGPRLRVLAEPTLRSVLARIGHPSTGTAELPGLVRTAYARLTFAALDEHFPSGDGRTPTRMTASEPRAVYSGPLLRADTRLVVCAVIRAGLLPAQVCYEIACQVLPPEHVRLDFLNLSRETDAHGRVTGVRMDGSKLGGDVRDAVVLVPDPMGATGGTLAHTAACYRSLGGGTPRAIVALHLMVTPEAVRRVLAECPEVHVLAGRFDRALSDPAVLATPPGTHPERERGLTDVQYIVPGAGGMGELLTNSWV
ncbi:MAG: uracil phosphoribosyltransferase [Planctomycetes bacterium]|nr:uracil phosphoribosyltransferase [Planctomycetota bacterium]